MRHVAIDDAVNISPSLCLLCRSLCPLTLSVLRLSLFLQVDKTRVTVTSVTPSSNSHSYHHPHGGHSDVEVQFRLDVPPDEHPTKLIAAMTLQNLNTHFGTYGVGSIMEVLSDPALVLS